MKVGGELVILGTDGPLPQQSFEGQGRIAGWQKGSLGFRGVSKRCLSFGIVVYGLGF